MISATIDSSRDLLTSPPRERRVSTLAFSVGYWATVKPI